MSDNWIILIPENAGFVPLEEKQKLAVEKFREIAPTSDEIEIEKTKEIRFVHCGGNYERILCPVCNKELDMRWWQGKMTEDFGADQDFKLNPIKLPCCGAIKTLHELNYQFPQGFARFSLEAMNPGLGKMPNELLAAIESILGCQLRIIYCHM
jgi:hypothetical protein